MQVNFCGFFDEGSSFRYVYAIGDTYPRQYGCIRVAVPAEAQAYSDSERSYYQTEQFAGLLVILTDLWQSERSFLGGEVIHRIPAMKDYTVFCQGYTLDLKNPPSFATEFLESQRYIRSILFPV